MDHYDANTIEIIASDAIDIHDSTSDSSSSLESSVSNVDEDTHVECSVLSSVKKRILTPTAFNLFCRKVWDSLTTMERAKFKQRACSGRNGMSTVPSEFDGAMNSDTSSIISHVFHTCEMIRSEMKARSGYLLTGKEKWAKVTTEQQNKFREDAKRLRDLDAEKYPPHGYCKNLRTIELPSVYNTHRALKHEMEGIISRCWKWLLKSIETRLMKAVLRDLKAHAVFRHGQRERVGMQVFINQINFSKVAWYTCFKSRVTAEEIVEETASSCTIELQDRKRVKQVFSFIEGLIYQQ